MHGAVSHIVDNGTESGSARTSRNQRHLQVQYQLISLQHCPGLELLGNAGARPSS